MPRDNNAKKTSPILRNSLKLCHMAIRMINIAI
jgi:hypothetical protein